MAAMQPDVRQLTASSFVRTPTSCGTLMLIRQNPCRTSACQIVSGVTSGFQVSQCLTVVHHLQQCFSTGGWRPTFGIAENHFGLPKSIKYKGHQIIFYSVSVGGKIPDG